MTAHSGLSVDRTSVGHYPGLMICFVWLFVMLSGCGTTYVSDAQKARGSIDSNTVEQVLQEPVYFEINSITAGLTPDCIHVLPFNDPGNLDVRSDFRKAFHAQLSVTGVRLVPLQAIDRAGASEIARTQDCAFELRGEVIENSRLFLGVYSQYKAGASVKLVHLPTGETYWSASHTMVKRSGGLPIGIIGTIAGVASAAKNLESDQTGRVSYELAYRMVKSIPKLQYFDQLESTRLPARPKPAEVKAGAEVGVNLSTQVLDGLKNAPTPSSERERLQHAVSNDDHSTVLTLVQELQKKGDKSAELYSLRGRARQGLGQHEKASTDFIAAIALGQDTDQAYLSLGKSYAALGRFDFAAAAFDKAAQLNGKNMDALMLGGLAHSANGDDEMAYEQLRLALVGSLAVSDKVNARRAVNALRSAGLFDRFSQKDQQFLRSQI